MTGFGFLILSFSSMLFFCKGQVSPPHDGKTLIFLPGSTGKIVWSSPGPISVGDVRFWTFTSRDDGSRNILARIIDDEEPKDLSKGLLAINVEKPSTLVLNNVNDSYNGIYEFEFRPISTPTKKSNVFVSIAKKPTATFSCSGSLKEGEDFTCLCRGENGNPPPNVTWHKDGKQIGGIEKNNKTLEIKNVKPKDNGTYTCRAQSYNDVNFRDEKSFEVTVEPFSQPSGTEITFIPPGPAEIGSKVTINCTSDGHPKPSYTITHDGREITTRIILKVQKNDAGIYKCFAENSLGNDSDSKNFTVKERSTTTKSSTMPSTRAASSGGGTAKTDNVEDSKLSVGEIVGIVIGVLAFIIIIAGVVYYFFCRSGENDGYRGKRDVSPGGRNDNQYEMGDNEYDTVKPGDGGEGSGEKPKKKNQPPVYAQVDKENRQGKPLYATLDTVALDSGGSKKRDEGRAQPTEYAAIDHSRTGDVPRADLV